MDTTYTSQPPLTAPVTPEHGSDTSTADQAKEKAQEAAGQAKQKAGSQLRSQVDQRSTEAGQRVSGIALGLVASRFLKASSSRRYEQRSTVQPRPTAQLAPTTPATPAPPAPYDTVS